MFKQRGQRAQQTPEPVMVRSSFVYRDGQVPPLTAEVAEELAELGKSRQEAAVGNQTLSLA